jgi:membrane protease YdiL (CAAX protease family)
MPAGSALLTKVIEGRNKAFIVLALLVLPYVFYAIGTADFHWSALGRLLAIAGPVVTVYSAFPVRNQAKFNWQDMLAAVWMVSIVLFHLFKGIWNVPVHLDFMGRLFMVSLGLFCWTYIRPVPDLGYRLEFSKKALLAAASNFTFFAGIAIPLGLVLGFTEWNPRWRGLPEFALAYLQILLFVAVLEEIFFRGFLQNLLEKSLRSWWLGQLIASCIFGLFHILHAPFPNWRYVVLASIAGWFYGSSYRAGGTLLSSALLHTAVDTVWRTFFTKG